MNTTVVAFPNDRIKRVGIYALIKATLSSHVSAKNDDIFPTGNIVSVTHNILDLLA